MQLFLDCYPCLLRQVLQAARIASTDEATQARIMDEAMLTLTQHHTFTTAPALAQTMHEIVQRHSGLTDPYQQIKARDMRAALRLEPFLTAFVDAGPDRLSRSLKLAATGNVMDSALYSNRRQVRRRSGGACGWRGCRAATFRIALMSGRWRWRRPGRRVVVGSSGRPTR